MKKKIGVLCVAAVLSALYVIISEWTDQHDIVEMAAGWFAVPAFFVYAGLCIITLTDFVSNSNDPHHLEWLMVLWFLANFIVLSIYGWVGLWVHRVIRQKRSPRNS